MFSTPSKYDKKMSTLMFKLVNMFVDIQNRLSMFSFYASMNFLCSIHATRFKITVNKLAKLELKKMNKTTLIHGSSLHHTQALISRCESAKTSKRSVSTVINLARFIIRDPYNMGIHPIQ